MRSVERLTDERRLAVALTITIVLVMALGSVQIFTESLWIRLDLDGEHTVPAVFSAGLLFAAALVAYRLASVEPCAPRAWLRTLAGGFAFMGLDELVILHERLEEATGLIWPVLYLPVIVAIGMAYLMVLPWLEGEARWLWIAGATAWVGSQLLELVQLIAFRHEFETTIYKLFAIGEEALEMVGSALLLLALAGVHRLETSCQTSRRRAPARK